MTASLAFNEVVGPFDLVLVDVGRDRIEFRARVFDEERPVSVLLDRFGARPRFPHDQWESGLSLGVEVLDQHVVDRALEILALRGRGGRRRR